MLFSYLSLPLRVGLFPCSEEPFCNLVSSSRGKINPCWSRLMTALSRSVSWGVDIDTTSLVPRVRSLVTVSNDPYRRWSRSGEWSLSPLRAISSRLWLNLTGPWPPFDEGAPPTADHSMPRRIFSSSSRLAESSICFLRRSISLLNSLSCCSRICFSMISPSRLRRSASSGWD